MINIRREWQNLLTLIAISFAVRLLLIPAYYSTDFVVHQNWLRITATLPLQEWYFNTDSQWTLDYPPLFAYFQAFLSSIALLIDSSIVSTINTFPQTILFQRMTVILSQIPLLMVLCLVCKKIDFVFVWTYFSLGFMLLDNIHFQYNTLMQAMLILAVYLVQEQRFYLGAICFAILLNIKHIYLYAAGAFFVFLFKYHVLGATNNGTVVKRLIMLGGCVAIPFLISFLPFVWVGGMVQINQIFMRLFPFQRGIVHEYWAPNIWAVYFLIDKIFGKQLLLLNSANSLRILPQIAPSVTVLLIIFVSIPLYIQVFRKKISFYKIVVLNGLLFFLFGFHVHEKAILPYIGLLFVFQQPQNKRSSINKYTFAAFFVNLLNLLPLLIDVKEKLLRMALLLLCGSIWGQVYGIDSRVQKCIIVIGVSMLYYHEVIHPFQSPSLEFLPLMMNSVFCATFNIFWTITLYKHILMSQSRNIPISQYKRVLEQQVCRKGVGQDNSVRISQGQR